MVLGGLWHGAAWKFVLWGAYQGAWLVLERAVGGKRLVTDWWHSRGAAGRLLWLVRVLVTFHFVCLGWLIFRAESTGPLWLMVRSFMDVTGWLRMPAGPALTAALAIAPVLAVDLAQYFSRDELVLLRIPAPAARRGVRGGRLRLHPRRPVRIECIHLLPVLSRAAASGAPRAGRPPPWPPSSSSSPASRPCGAARPGCASARATPLPAPETR